MKNRQGERNKERVEKKTKKWEWKNLKNQQMLYTVDSVLVAEYRNHHQQVVNEFEDGIYGG